VVCTRGRRAKGPESVPVPNVVVAEGTVGDGRVESIVAAMLDLVGFTVSSLDPGACCCRRLAIGIDARSSVSLLIDSLALSAGKCVSISLISGFADTTLGTHCELRGDHADCGLCLLITTDAFVSK
jgi:hypothetical protein